MAQRTPLFLSFTALFGSALAVALAGHSLDAQTFDATGLREPAEIGATGLVQAGDNPAYARPDFDDSKWLPVDAKTPLRGYFPREQSTIVWHRIHINVGPCETRIALQA